MNVVCPACHGAFDLDELKIADDTLLICPECMAEFSYGDRIQDGAEGDSGDGAEAEAPGVAEEAPDSVEIDPLAAGIVNMELGDSAAEDAGNESPPEDPTEGASSGYSSTGSEHEPEVIGGTVAVVRINRLQYAFFQVFR